MIDIKKTLELDICDELNEIKNARRFLFYGYPLVLALFYILHTTKKIEFLNVYEMIFLAGIMGMLFFIFGTYKDIAVYRKLAKKLNKDASVEEVARYFRQLDMSHKGFDSSFYIRKVLYGLILSPLSFYVFLKRGIFYGIWDIEREKSLFGITETLIPKDKSNISEECVKTGWGGVKFYDFLFGTSKKPLKISSKTIKDKDLQRFTEAFYKFFEYTCSFTFTNDGFKIISIINDVLKLSNFSEIIDQKKGQNSEYPCETESSINFCGSFVSLLFSIFIISIYEPLQENILSAVVFLIAYMAAFGGYGFLCSVFFVLRPFFGINGYLHKSFGKFSVKKTERIWSFISVLLKAFFFAAYPAGYYFISFINKTNETSYWGGMDINLFISVYTGFIIIFFIRSVFASVANVDGLRSMITTIYAERVFPYGKMGLPDKEIISSFNMFLSMDFECVLEYLDILNVNQSVEKINDIYFPDQTDNDVFFKTCCFLIAKRHGNSNNKDENENEKSL